MHTGHKIEEGSRFYLHIKICLLCKHYEKNFAFDSSKKKQKEKKNIQKLRKFSFCLTRLFGKGNYFSSVFAHSSTNNFDCRSGTVFSETKL